MADVQEEMTKKEAARMLFKEYSKTVMLLWFSILAFVIIIGVSLGNIIYSSMVAIGITIYHAYHINRYNLEMNRLKQKYDIQEKTTLGVFRNMVEAGTLDK